MNHTPCIVPVRLSTDEAATLRNAAATLGISVSRLARQRLFPPQTQEEPQQPQILAPLFAKPVTSRCARIKCKGCPKCTPAE